MSKAAILALAIIIGAMTMILSSCVIENSPRAALEPSPTSGVYQFEVGNSLYPKSRGASIGFQRYLSAGEDVRGSLEWQERYSVRYKWSLYVYAPDGSMVRSWSGQELKNNFSFIPAAAGTYRLEILKRDFEARRALLTIEPPDWNRWGKD